jgi:hypothetical protein
MLQLSKEKRVYGYDNNFVSFFLNDWHYLFDAIIDALPGLIEGKVVTAQLTPMLGRLTRAVFNSMAYFNLSCPSLQALFPGMFGYAYWLHSAFSGLWELLWDAPIYCGH